MLSPFPEVSPPLTPETERAITERALALQRRRRRRQVGGAVVAAAVVVVAVIAVVVPGRSHQTRVISGTGSAAEATRAIRQLLDAHSFVMDLSVGGVSGVHVVYQGPDRVEQIEQGSGSSASPGGSRRTSGRR